MIDLLKFIRSFIYRLEILCVSGWGVTLVTAKMRKLLYSACTRACERVECLGI